MTSLGSKVVSKYKESLAEIAVKAVQSVEDISRTDVNFDLIKVIGKIGKGIEDTSLVQGIVLDKEFSHCQMIKEIVDAKVVL
jgi:T-complex protein 1 subunit epsilon